MSKLADAYIDAVGSLLEQRGSRYGNYSGLAAIAQELKEVMHTLATWQELPPVMQESLDLIASKIARILNGDPTYVDNWDDIAGYATLVSERLKGIER